MKGKATFLGHPIHPMVIVIPLGLLPAAVVCDVVHLANKAELAGHMAYWLILGGILGGLFAGIFGFIDWLSIPRQTRAKRIGAWHAITNLVVLALFAVSWFMRRPDPAHPGLFPILLGMLALGGALLSGWLGAELIYRLSIGVDDAAHPNAPNSLSQKSVT